MQDQKREKERLKKQKQRASMTPEKKAAYNEQRAMKKKSQQGRERNKIDCKKYQEKKRDQKATIARQRKCIADANQENHTLKKANERVKKEADLFRVQHYAKQVQDQPLKGDKEYRASVHAQVPVMLQQLADRVKDIKPEKVITVLNRTLPVLEDKINDLDDIEDEFSQYSQNLDELEKREEAKKMVGYKRIREGAWNEIRAHNKHLKSKRVEDKERLSKLHQKYDVMMERRTTLTKEAREDLLQQIELKDHELKLLHRKCEILEQQAKRGGEEGPKQAAEAQQAGLETIQRARAKAREEVKEEVLKQKALYEAENKRILDELQKLQIEKKYRACCQQTRLDNEAMKKRQEAHTRELSTCLICMKDCDAGHHWDRVREIKADEKKREELLERIGLEGPKVPLRTILRSRTTQPFQIKEPVEEMFPTIPLAEISRHIQIPEPTQPRPTAPEQQQNGEEKTMEEPAVKTEEVQTLRKVSLFSGSASKAASPFEKSENIEGTPENPWKYRASLDEWVVEPNNDGNREFLERDLGQNTKNCPYAYSTINKNFHQELTARSKMSFKSCRFKGKGVCIELMGGVFRNGPLLRSFFSEVEVLERNETMVNAIKKLKKGPDTIYQEDVRYFDWASRAERYQCVFGVWCLCYLNKRDSIALLYGIKKTLRRGGCLVLFESIVGAREIVDRFNDIEEQQMVVRLYERYTRLFVQCGFVIVSEKRHKAWTDGVMWSEDYASFTLMAQ